MPTTGTDQPLPQLKTLRAEKQTQVEKLDASYKTVKDEHTSYQTKLSTAEELLQTLLTGLSSNAANTSGGGYMGQLADAKGRIAHAQAEEEQSKVKLKMSEKELKTLEGRWKEVEREAREGQNKLAGVTKAVEECRARLQKSGWNEEMEKAGEEKLRSAKAEVRHLNEVGFCFSFSRLGISKETAAIRTRQTRARPAQLRLCRSEAWVR